MDEVERTLKKFGLEQEKIEHLFSEIETHFPDSFVEQGYKQLISSMKNDEKDKHVVAAAVKAGCEVIVTYNLKHFKTDDLSPFDVVARHPDEFLIDLYYLNPEIVVHMLHQQGASLKEKLELPQVLKLLRNARCIKFADLIAEKLSL